MKSYRSSGRPREADVLFRATFDCGWSGRAGFAWLPDGPPTRQVASPAWLADTTYDHIGGPWYLTCEDPD